MAAVFVLCILPLLKSRAYETFVMIHRMAATIMFIAVWYHIRISTSFSRVLWLLTLISFFLIFMIRILLQLYRNILYTRKGMKYPWIEVNGSNEGTQVFRICLARPWRLEPGQYVLVTSPKRKHLYSLQRHPFVVVWWESQSSKRGTRVETNVLYIVVQKKAGWTSNIGYLTPTAVWLDGPFGRAYYLHTYSLVTLFASGHGILAQIPLIKGIIDQISTDEEGVRTKKLRLVWQCEELYPKVKEWMNQILSSTEHRKDVS